jgi:molybdopterin converting factor small subunit
MPITAKLSRKFYEQFGDDLANEFVDWFNAVDATYREDLEQVNRANFDQFDARLGQRIAELEARIDRRFAEWAAAMERRMDARIGELREHVDRQIGELRQHVDRQNGEVNGQIGELRTQLADLRIEFRDGLAEVRHGLMRWMFVFWATTILAIFTLHFG